MPRMTAAQRYRARKERKAERARLRALAAAREQADHDWFMANIAPNLNWWNEIVERYNRPGVVHPHSPLSEEA